VTLPRTVALVDWEWGGHHPTYFVHFAATLASLGVRVVPLCGAPEAFWDRYHEALGEPSPEARRLIEPPLRVELPLLRPIRPWRLQPLERSARHFWRLRRLLRGWERRARTSLDLVFFACVYDTHFQGLSTLAPLFPYPWSGLYLHARWVRMPGSPIPQNGGRLPCPEQIFTHPRLRAVALLDEAAVGPMGALTGGKPVHVFPDITNDQLPPPGDPRWGLAEKVLTFAQGRKVVTCAGHLLRTKGVLELCRASQLPAAQELAFVFAGEASWWDYTPEEQAEVRAVWEGTPNVFTHLQREAAWFERPVVVSDGHLMAERVRAYRLGEVVPEGDVEALASALQRLTEAPPASPRHAEYRQAHSPERLRAAFEALLET
jgi:hypothetical protein